MSDEEQKIRVTTVKRLFAAVKAELALFTPADLTEAAVSLLPGHFDSIKRLYVDLSSAVDEFEEDFADKTTLVDQFKIKLNTVRDDISKNRKDLMEKKQSFLPVTAPGTTPTLTHSSANTSLSSTEEQMQSHLSLLRINEERTLTEMISKAEDDCNEIAGEIGALEDDIKEHAEAIDELKDKEDVEIRIAMQELNSWKKRKQDITKAYRKYNSLVNKIEKSLTAEIAADNGRKDAAEEMESIKTDKEDLSKKFDDMDEFVHSFLDELREEDTTRALHSRDTEKVKDVEWPRFSGKENEDFSKFKEKLERAFQQAKTSTSAKVDKLRALLSGHAKDLVPDGVKDIKTALDTLNDAFGDPSRLVNFKLKLLNEAGMLPVAEKKGYRAQVSFYLKLQGIIEDLLALGSQSDELALHAFHRSSIYALTNRFPNNLRTKLILKHSKLKGKEQLEGMLSTLKIWREEAQVMESAENDITPKKDHSESTKSTNEKRGMKVHIVAPFRMDDCVICQEFSRQGGHGALFINHVGKFPTGCPRFLELAQKEKYKLAKKLELCLTCLNPSSISQPSRHKPCRSRHPFYCKGRACKTHIILCNKHVSENKEFLDKYRDLVGEKDILFQIGIANLMPNLSADTNMSVHSARNMKKLNIGMNKDSTLLPVPSGNPMFMFCNVPGKTRNINIMVDCGCSHACFKYGAVVHQLNGFCTSKGEFPVNVAGGAQIKAKGEWMISLKKRSGDFQAVVGLAVDQVTVDFPQVNLSGAVDAIKASAPKNKFVQSCKVPMVAGGSVDVLLGIQYASLFPKLIHMLPCGLGIYELELESPGAGFNACIAGPHETLAALSLKAGGSRNLFTHFIQGLETWRTVASAAPMLEMLPPTQEELALNQQLNFLEDDTGLIKALCKHEKHDDDDMLNVADPVSCSHVSIDEKLTLLKNRLPHEIPLDLDYRCISCRNCSKCLDSDNQEKISLREEAELAQCMDSVRLDYENSRIICNLPLRGDEQKFLGPNRDIAAKILDQQVRKYKGRPEVEKMILKAFDKMFSNGHIRLVKDLDENERLAFENKPTQHYIPWRIAFSGSVTTPARPVFDASSRTNKNPDGTGGRCLNDLTSKGRITSLNLSRLLLRFMVGRHAIAGDLSQFYNTCKLVPSQWNLQRILWKSNLDSSLPAEEAVIVTLIYGQISASCQTECAMEKLAEDFADKYPNVYSLLVKSRYVDDMAESKQSIDECERLKNDANTVLGKVGVHCKAWTVSGNKPDETVSKDGVTIGVGGFKWNPIEDKIEVKVPNLYFAKKSRGRLAEETVFFNPDLHEIDDFVPKNLSLRAVTSKYASIFDYLGFLSPALARTKVLLRKTVKATIGWDDAMSTELRSKWLKEFLFIEKLRGLKFNRAKMPPDAIDCNMRALCGGDAADEVLILGAWGGFKLRNGDWSCQLLVGKSLLCADSWTIPMGELVGLMGSGNLAWTLKLAFTEWLDQSRIFNFSDSNIALCWATSEGKKMGTFHRNRVIQIRRSVNINNLYHVRTKHQPCDLGTRPEKVRVEDVSPDSPWFNGLPWMRMDIDRAVELEILTPVTKLRLSEDEKIHYKRGLIIDSEPEIITHGHFVSEKRTQAILDRAKYSKDLYILNPGKWPFRRTVRILSYATSFVSKLMKRALGRDISSCILKGGNKLVSAFSSLMGDGHASYDALPSITITSSSIDTEMTELLSMFDPGHTTDVGTGYCGRMNIYNSTHSHGGRLTDKFISMALVHLFKVATLEVKKFNSKDYLSKIAIEQDGILVSKNRLHEGLSFISAGELSSINLGDLGINIAAPLVDRYSELAYSIGNHMHYVLGRHRGIETTHRMTLEHVHIIQAMSLHREIASDCIICKKKQKKFLEVEMGPQTQATLTVAPPFYTTMMDLMGPFGVYVPGFEARTRNRKVLEAKVWVVVFCCPATRNINLQVIEKSDGDGIIDAITRLSCEVGIPKFILCDKQTSIERALKQAQIEMRDLQDRLIMEFGIVYQTCPPSGHNFHGQVERAVRSIRDAMSVSGASKQTLHATGLQTLMKIIENQINNVPLGYAFGRDCDNSSTLRIITPSMLRHGRINSRALDGPIRLADNLGKMMQKVDDTYRAWFKIWRDTWVPKLMRYPKWFDSSVDLEVGDLVYFQRTATELGHVQDKWVVGKIDRLDLGKDKKIRRVWIKYKNAGENVFQVTERSVRSVIKIFSLSDASIQEDLLEVQKFMRGLLAENFGGFVDRSCSGVMDPVGYGPAADRVIGSGVKSFHLGGEEIVVVQDYLVEDSFTADMVSTTWDVLEEPYYGGVFGQDVTDSLTEVVLKMEL